MAFGRSWLTPPTKPVFIISVLLALVAVLVWLGVVRIAFVQAKLFEVLLAAYVVLLLGNVAKGL
jgi:hypothetical protein